MWSDDVKERYWWVDIRNQIERFLWELSKAEDEEGVDLYLLSLHFENKSDLEFFTEVEKNEIKKLLSVLMTDTEKHLRLLNEMSEELRTLGEGNVKEAI